MRAGVARPLVEPDAGDIAGDVGLELDPQIDGAGVIGRSDRSGVTELFQRVYRPVVENDQLTGTVIVYARSRRSPRSPSPCRSWRGSAPPMGVSVAVFVVAL